jgi:hypothetical protein
MVEGKLFSLRGGSMSSRTKLEREYQSYLIGRIEEMLEGCLILKNDSGYRQGIPDLSIFYGPRWVMLEVKPKYPRPGSRDFEPNQEWYIENLGQMSYVACIYPEIEEEVLREVQRSLQPGRKARSAIS